MKILILRFSSIGDIVLTTPVIRCLKGQLGAEIHYATKKQYLQILESNPYIHKLHALDSSLGDLIDNLRKESFDVIIDLHNNLRTQIIKLALQKKSYSFKKLNVAKWLLVNFKVRRLPNIHIVDRYMETIKPMGVENDHFGLDYFIAEKDEVEPDWLPETHRKDYIAFAIGAKFATKRLPLDRMIELCDKINKPIILLGGAEDVETGNKIEAFFKRNENDKSWDEGLDALNKKTKIFNTCGKFSLNQSASVLRSAKVVFSHDTGLMHIAAAFKKTIYSIWGNTVPEFGMYPYQTKFIILENKKLNCRPCSKIGFSKCPKRHFNCMNKIVFDFYIP